MKIRNQMGALRDPDDENAACTPWMKQARRDTTNMVTHSFPIDTTLDVDVLVVGSGMAGICAAIAAARNDCHTAILEMDECLGGNGGPMLGVHISGAHSFHPYASETGIIEELELEAARLRAKTRTWGDHYNISHAWDLLLESRLEAAGVQIFRRCQGRHALVDGRRITGVVAVDIEHFSVRLFNIRHAVIDASGDGMVARSAGASYMLGTESREVFAERSGKPSSSRETMGTSITALVRKCRQPVEFCLPPEFAARAAAEGPPEKLKGFPPSWQVNDECCFLWVTESGGNQDTIQDAAAIRREILYQLYRTWDNVKNHSFAEQARNWELIWVSPKSGKRESHRFKGDYILTQTDVENAMMFPDAIGYGGYGVDIHEPVGTGTRIVFYSIPPLWTFPYRAAYSRDLDNLWLAGRLMSVSHLALGTVRLMRTLAGIGQGIGTAVALAMQLGCTAREVGTTHLDRLRQLMLKQDSTLLNVPNTDPADLARQARVEATSEMRHGACRPVDYLPLDVPRGVQLWDWAPTLERVGLLVRNRADAPRNLRLELSLFREEKRWKEPDEYYPVPHVKGARNRMEWGVDNRIDRFEKVADASISVPPASEGWQTVIFPQTIAMVPVDPMSDEVRYNLIAAACPDLDLAVDRLTYDFALRIRHPDGANCVSAEAGCHCFTMEPAPAYGEAMNVIDGHHRRYSTNPVHAWLSDVEESLPQSLTLTFPAPAEIAEVHLTFDTIDRAYRDAPVNCGEAYARRCVTDYCLEAECDGTWNTVATATDNYLRKCVHTFEPVVAARLRLTVTGVRDPAYGARVYEVRAYGRNSGEQASASA